MRVVLDTNVLVSALTLPGGRGEAAVRRVIEGADTLLVSRPLVLELLDVLARKFDRDAEELARVALFLNDSAQVVEPNLKLDVLADEPDHRVLEVAVAGNADVIVTGDRDMLALGRFRGIRIMSLRAHLDG